LGKVPATLVKEPPAGNLWLHELKFDGYRMLAESIAAM
jgi:ATP-dependent DNA ligase